MFSACSLDRPRRRSRSSVDSMLHSMPFGIFGSPGRRCVYGFCDGKLIVPSELRRGFDRYSPRFASRYSIFSSRVNSRRSSPSGRWSRSLVEVTTLVVTAEIPAIAVTTIDHDGNYDAHHHDARHHGAPRGGHRGGSLCDRRPCGSCGRHDAHHRHGGSHDGHRHDGNCDARHRDGHHGGNRNARHHAGSADCRRDCRDSHRDGRHDARHHG